jgi:large subunit ribosomal protein L23
MIVLQKPIISEKSLKLAGISQFTFVVNKDASKPQIAKAVSEQFKVDVLSVKTINVKGERKVQRRSGKSYQTTGFKKAYVQLKKGQKIALFEAPKEEVKVTTAEGEPQVMREKKDLLGRTKVRVEKGATGAAPTTQRKVITGK